MCKWTDFYRDREGYFEYFCKKYRPFLDEVVNNLPSYLHGIGEFGCGMGNTTRYLLDTVDHCHYLYDKSEDVIRICKDSIGLPDNKVKFHKHNILDSLGRKRFDLIHSHGVLEHFSDEDIRAIVLIQMFMTDVAVHYVPTDGYNKPSFGDERLMPVSEWERILSNFNCKFIPFNDDKDLTIVVTK